MLIDVGPAESTHCDSEVPVIGDDRPNLLGTPDRLTGGTRWRAQMHALS